MGTHCYVLLRVKEKDGTYSVWTKIYTQYDGYPEGVGKRLCIFLKDIQIVQGLPYPVPPGSKMANGAGCLFAQIVLFMKSHRDNEFQNPLLSDVGGYVYLCNPMTTDLEEWNYTIDVDENAHSVHMQVFQDWDTILHSGTPSQVLESIEQVAEK